MIARAWSFLILLFAASYVPAQTPPPPPARYADIPGPGMDETVAFINDALTNGGKVRLNSGTWWHETLSQQVHLQDHCSLVITRIARSGPLNDISDLKGHAVLDYSSSDQLNLENSDPASISVQETSDYTPELYKILIARSIHTPQSFEMKGDLAFSDLPDQFDSLGTIQTISGDAVTFVTSDGARVSVPTGFNSRTKVYYDGKPTQSTADFRAGDRVHFSRMTFDHGGKGRPKDLNRLDSIDVIPENVNNLRPLVLGQFIDDDVAHRVSKAYVHAMSLCYRDKPKSLF